MGAREITAKFASPCKTCGSQVPAGGRCLWTPGEKGVTHVTCPTTVDAELELTGEGLRARLAQLEELAISLAPVLEDRILELSGEPRGSTCPFCSGTGITTSQRNCSPTLDYSDWQSFPHACGTVLTWDHSNVKHPDDAPTLLLDGQRAWFQQHPGDAGRWKGAYAVEGGPTRNERCIAAHLECMAYNRERAIAEWQAHDEQPAHRFIGQLVAWVKADLQVQRGDTAIVINRGKERTGRVVWVGEADGGELRCKVIDAEGKGWGGPVATAKLVSRRAVFSPIRLGASRAA